MKQRVIALGFFDGVHLGHGALLRRAAEDDLQVRIFPTLSAEQLHEEVERAARRSPADEFIAKAAAPEEPPAEI